MAHEQKIIKDKDYNKQGSTIVGGNDKLGDVIGNNAGAGALAGKPSREEGSVKAIDNRIEFNKDTSDNEVVAAGSFNYETTSSSIESINNQNEDVGQVGWCVFRTALGIDNTSLHLMDQSNLDFYLQETPSMFFGKNIKSIRCIETVDPDDSTKRKRVASAVEIREANGRIRNIAVRLGHFNDGEDNVLKNLFNPKESVYGSYIVLYQGKIITVGGLL